MSTEDSEYVVVRRRALNLLLLVDDLTFNDYVRVARAVVASAEALNLPTPGRFPNTPDDAERVTP